MRKLLAALLAAILIICALPALSESPSLQEKHEELAVKVAQTIARYGSDDANLSRPDYFAKDSEALKTLKSFDSGWFTKTERRIFSEARTDNWVALSDTEFQTDVYFDYTIHYVYYGKVETFHCAYRLVFRQTNSRSDTWQLVDFSNLPTVQDEEYAAHFTDTLEGISVYPVTGKCFTGFMAVIDDPSRVYVGTIDYFGSNAEGLRIDALSDKYKAVGGINGGGFNDTAGSGNGGQAKGLIITQGTQKNAYSNRYAECAIAIGFDANDRLIVGKFDTIDDLGLRDAMAFNQALVIDGENVASSGKKLLYTARTAIGQDADGRVLMLVVKGREPDSLGASFENLAEVMLSYGAVNAANLDGGTSTTLYLNKESVYSGYRLDVSRKIPAAFLIKPIE